MFRMLCLVIGWLRVFNDWFCYGVVYFDVFSLLCLRDVLGLNVVC